METYKSLDGITIKLNKKDIDKINAVNLQLTKETKLVIEDAYYDKMIIRDVNNYIAVYKGSNRDNEMIKLKGAYEDTPEFHKDHSMLIVPKAVKEYFVYGTPIEETIRNSKDIFDFCLRLKINNSSKAEYHTIKGSEINIENLSRTTRYYVSNKGGGLVVYYNGSDKVNRRHIGYNTTLFNNYYESEDYDINYSFYEMEARKLINAIEDYQLKLF